MGGVTRDRRSVAGRFGLKIRIFVISGDLRALGRGSGIYAPIPMPGKRIFRLFWRVRFSTTQRRALSKLAVVNRIS